jgi:hypothetical protein
VRQQRTLRAFWFTGLADRPAVVDQEVRPERPVALRHDLYQVLLDLHRIGVIRQAQALREPRDVGVHDDADVLVEGVAQDDVRGLPPHSRQAGQLLHRLRDFPAVFLQKAVGHASQALGFVAVEACGLDGFLQFLLRRGRVSLGGFVFLEETFRDNVDAVVRALRGEDGGDEEFQGVGVFERAFGVGVGFFEDGEDGADSIQAGLQLFGRGLGHGV